MAKQGKGKTSRKKGDWMVIERSRQGGSGRIPVPNYGAICEHGSPRTVCKSSHGGSGR